MIKNGRAMRGPAQDGGMRGSVAPPAGSGAIGATGAPPPLSSSPPLMASAAPATAPIINSIPVASGLAGPSSAPPAALTPQDIVNTAYGPAQRSGATQYDDLINASRKEPLPGGAGAGANPALAPPLYPARPAQRGGVLE